MENEPQDAYLPGAGDEALEPFDVREQSNKRGMMWLIGGVLFLLALAFVVLKLFSAGTRDRDQTPRILADNTPYKEVPLERGGEQTPNQDKEIYQKLNGTQTEEAVKTVEVAEQPLPKPQAEAPKANVVIKEPAVEKPAPAKPIEKPKPVVRTPVTASGNYVVQVASLRSNAEATALWTKLGSKMDGVLTSSHTADIKRADLGAKGIYYRLRVAGLADKAAATNLCTRLKARGQDCIVTKK